MQADILIMVHLGLMLISSAGGYRRVNPESIGTLYRWKQMEFNYPSPEARQQAIDKGEFIQANVIPLGIERWKNRIFVSTPRWKKGIPASLSAVPLVSLKESPPLTPYPSWDQHDSENCTGFTSVFRMTVDHCGVMWVIDSGQIEAFENPRQICPPALYAVDLEKDAIIGRYPIPEQYILQNSLMSNIVVDSRDPLCRDLHVYMADVWRYGIVVFKAADASFWRFSHYSFIPEPLLCNYTLHGLNYHWTDGVFGLSLGKFHQGDRPVFYHAMSSSLEFVVPASVLRNASRVNDSVHEFKLLGDSRGRKGQVSAAAVDRNGIMFFNLVSQDSIGCWDTRKPYKPKHLGIIAKSEKALVFPNDLRIDHELPQFVWIITNKLPMYQYNLIDPKEYNFRVLYVNPVQSIKGSICQPY